MSNRMSRRHHGRPHHPAHGTADGGRRVTGVSQSPASAGPERSARADQGDRTEARPTRNDAAGIAPAGNAGTHDAPLENGRTNGMSTNGTRPAPAGPAPAMAGHIGPNGGNRSVSPDRNGQCTAPQLRRFIKSRPYVPMHELRRRFAIDGGDDDVTPVRLDPGWVYVGLPNREGSLLGDLLRAGEIGYELSLDPRTPIVIGVYPMRPIPRG